MEGLAAWRHTVAGVQRAALQGPSLQRSTLVARLAEEAAYDRGAHVELRITPPAVVSTTRTGPTLNMHCIIGTIGAVHER